jgi:hypothetical protein
VTPIGILVVSSSSLSLNKGRVLECLVALLVVPSFAFASTSSLEMSLISFISFFREEGVISIVLLLGMKYIYSFVNLTFLLLTLVGASLCSAIGGAKVFAFVVVLLMLLGLVLGTVKFALSRLCSEAFLKQDLISY